MGVFLEDPYKRLRNKLLQIVFSILLIILIWQLLSLVLNKSYVPSFTAVSYRLVLEIIRGDILRNTAISMTRILIAMTLSTSISFLIGVLVAWRNPGIMSSFLRIIVYLTYPIPHIALLPIFFYLFGVEWSKIILILIITFYPTSISVIEWSSRFPRELSELIYVMGGDRLDLLRHVILPSSLPGILTGIRISFNTAYAVVFIAESLVGGSGLGYMIYYYWSILDFEGMYSAVLMLSILGVSTYFALEYLEHKILKWIY